MKYKIKNKKTGNFISNYEDHSDREGYCIGTFGVRPDGELIFFEATDGGMDEIECPDLEVVLEQKP
jgi:hypothetical protein